MPGSGKSTLGAELAVVLGYHFFDLDVEIEINEGLTVPEIFKKRGAAEFRKAERNNLLEITNKKKSFLMSTGGGTPCYHDNMDFMNQNGLTVFINPNVEVILQRVVTQEGQRPLFSKMDPSELRDKVYQLYEKRYAYYSKAQVIIAEGEINIRTITHKLLEAKS